MTNNFLFCCAIGCIIAILFRRSPVVRTIVVFTTSIILFIVLAYRTEGALSGERNWLVTLNYLIYMSSAIFAFFFLPMMLGSFLTTHLLARYRPRLINKDPGGIVRRLAIAYIVYAIIIFGILSYWLWGALRWINGENFGFEAPYTLNTTVIAIAISSATFSICSLLIGLLIRRNSHWKLIFVLAAITCLSIPIGTALGVILFEAKKKEVKAKPLTLESRNIA